MISCPLCGEVPVQFGVFGDLECRCGATRVQSYDEAFPFEMRFITRGSDSMLVRAWRCGGTRVILVTPDGWCDHELDDVEEDRGEAVRRILGLEGRVEAAEVYRVLES
jgi:hypothetical protein